MAGFLEKRKIRKLVRHVLHEARHARHMREDVADASAVEGLRDAQQKLKAAAASGASYADVERAAEHTVEKARGVYPLPANARFRENLEVLIVAVAVAMAFRAYFLQPFKIPTGSMQPTLYGITFERQDSKTWRDVLPINIVNFLLTGERYVEVKAGDSGRLAVDPRSFNASDTQFMYLRVGQVVHKVRRGIPLVVQLGEFVSKGQTLAGGRMRHGDHIFVNKMKYNFTRPSRGDVFVFKTRNIEYPEMDRNTFYIKRLVGMPGEEIRINKRHLVADGVQITEPEPFRRMLEHPDYPKGYSLAMPNPRGTILDSENDVYRIGPEHYLPMGDNTDASLDGRYFGAVGRKDVVGPAFSVYWPFGRRWGFIR